MEINIQLKNGEYKLLKSVQSLDKKGATVYDFVDAKMGNKVYLKLELNNNQLILLEKDKDLDEPDSLIALKLDELLLSLNPSEASLGTEQNEVEDEAEKVPYDPEKIRVDTKTFSLRQVYDMMDSEDIDLTPDFQRNLVWDEVRKSRLIESILLRIPLPMFYFAQDEDGKIAVVDGLQRLSTIRDFMNNKFPLNHLEYLQTKCKGKYYKNQDAGIGIDGKPFSAKIGIDGKFFRWFNMTQITVHIIDASSPFKLKYDIFRRINTGGQALNGQEIRNCLSSKGLRTALNQMAKLQSFKNATGNSVKDTRMESQQLALRFILFHKKYTEEATLNTYSGNIESELNELTESLSRNKPFNYEFYIHLFDRAMQNAYHLFGMYCFRKTLPQHLVAGAKRQLINKALFASWSVALSRYGVAEVRSKNKWGCLSVPLSERIAADTDLFFKLSFGTNAKLNNQIVLKAVQDIIAHHLNL